MRHLRSVSILLFVAGLALLVAAPLLDLAATWALTGLLLAWAGVVKVVVVRLWRGLGDRPGGAPGMPAALPADDD